MRIDDSYISYYLKQKKKKMSFLKINNLYDIIKPYNVIFPNSDGGRYTKKNLKYVDKLIKKIKFKKSK